MRESLRRRLVWASGVGALLQFAVFAIAALQGVPQIPQDVLAGTIYGVQALNVFAWATVLDLAWWASGGALLAAFALAHRRGAPPEAAGATPRGGAR